MSLESAALDGFDELHDKLELILARLNELANREYGCSCNHPNAWQWTPPPTTSTAVGGGITTYWPPNP